MARSTREPNVDGNCDSGRIHGADPEPKMEEHNKETVVVKKKDVTVLHAIKGPRSARQMPPTPSKYVAIVLFATKERPAISAGKE
jgi:hypothetical protein